MGKALLTKADVTILLESEYAIREYPELASGLSKGTARVDHIPPSISSFTLSEIISNCMQEWRYDERTPPLPVTVDSDLKECQLCFTESVKSLHLIRNKISSKELWVGSNCVLNYKIDNHENLDSLLRRQAKTKKHEKLLSIRPELAEEFVLQKQPYSQRASYFIPMDMEKACVQYFRTIRELIDNYLMADISDHQQILSDIDFAVKSYQLVCVAVDKFQEEHSSDWLYPRKLSIKNMPPAALRKFRINLRIDSSTLAYVIDDDFATSHILPRLNKIVSEFGVVFSTAQQAYHGIVYKGTINSYYVEIDHKVLCRAFSPHLIKGEVLPFTHKVYFLGFVSVATDPREFLMDELQYLKKWGYIPASYSYAYDRLYIKNSGLYVLLALSSTEDILKPFALSQSPYDAPNAIVRLVNNAPKIDREEYDEAIRMSSFLNDRTREGKGRIDPEYTILEQ